MMIFLFDINREELNDLYFEIFEKMVFFEDKW